MWKTRKHGTRRQRGTHFLAGGRHSARKLKRPPPMDLIGLEPTKPINMILKGLSKIFPQFSPIFEGGRFILNNRQFFIPIIKALFSNDSTREKLRVIDHQIENVIKRKAISASVDDLSKEIAKVIDQQIGFDIIARKMDPNSSQNDANLFESFFENSLSKIIEAAVLGT